MRACGWAGTCGPGPDRYKGSGLCRISPSITGQVRRSLSCEVSSANGALAMDDVTTGARLRTLRRWRGMTQTELAGLAGLSPSFVSMVEHGERMLDRRSHVAAVANALRVSETDLVGGPHLSQDRLQSDPHMAIPALRAALQTNKMTDAAVERARPLPELVTAVTDRVLPLRVRC